MNKAVFLDRDGTINVEKHYLHRVEDFDFLPDAVDGLRLLQKAGFKLIIITNQSGIARGYYTEEDYRVLNGWMLAELKRRGINIDAAYYCPHLPGAKIEKYRQVCSCRKPALGLFNQAVEDFDIDLAQSFAIGDKRRDCAICEMTACRGFLIGENEDVEILAAAKEGKYKNIRYTRDLLEAARIIVEETK